MPPLHIRVFTLGDWMTNCHVVHAEDGGPCWIVDAGFDPGDMVKYVADHELEPAQIVLTHAHIDHIAGLLELRAAWPTLPITIHEDERAFLTDPALNLSGMLPTPIVAPDATATVAHGDSLSLQGATFDVIHTPGHSPGGITLHCAEAAVAIVGDALFAGSIGRTDFPTSDHQRLMQSLRDLMTLPDETRVLSGHGPETTIGAERRLNPFVREAGESD
ncbi:MAG: hypothetical protein CMJ18_07995 [Phycisphaeraceae bacterium]|nr:hypothetical protein [Phycisphaeraceae bacterium]